jgi:predicted  nucleic acid-binding Zn-ribbon protein
MPHKCTKCGREFEDGSTEILKGCPSCGGKKFLYIGEVKRHDDVLEEKTIDEIATETGEEELEVTEVHAPTNTTEEGQNRVDCYDRVESIRILGPGSYELNIEKLAQNEEMVVGYGKEGQYFVDILSMGKRKKKE